MAPAGANVQAGIGTQQFTATVTNETSSSVSWTVNGIQGGNATIGTISASGLYTAPADAPATPTVTVTAILMADRTRFGSGNVTIKPRVKVALSPTSASVQAGSGTQAFVPTISNTANVGLTWMVNGVTGGNATVGTISATGLYKAPAAAPSPAMVTVSAASVVDPGRPGTASVTVTAPLAVTVTVSPTTANVQAGIGTQAMTVAVGNTTNTAVTWQVNGVTGGNATLGTVSAAGMYQAPASVPVPATVTVTAVSVADPTRSGFAALTITPPVSVSVTPPSASVQAGIGSQSFTATVGNTANSGVSWRVNGVTGGNATVGLVSASGLYTAPTSVPSPATVTVSAVSVVDGTRSGSATVTITSPVVVSVTPSSASVQAGIGAQTFTATVGNSANASVTWQVNGVTGGNASVGTISAAGVYKAPNSVPAPAAVTVTAVSVADPTRSGSAAITITPPVTVVVTPASASVQAGLGSQAFTATVSNSANTTVTWQVSGVTGGNAVVGTISAAGLYHAPANVPAPAAVTVTAVSAADATRSGTATLTITAPVSVSVTPSTATVQAAVGSQVFTATVANAGNTSVTWQVNGVTGGTATTGTVSASGDYTAPASVPSPASVTVTAISAADPSRSGSSTVTITSAVSVTVSPSSATAQAGIGSQTFTATVANSANTSVTWQVNGVVGGNATVGTISAAGVYKAPASVPSPAIVTITAVSVADPTHFGSATLTITAAVAITVSPSLASVHAGSGTQQFTATVTNGSTGAVSWKVNGIAGGSAAVGTVSAAGLYAAPATVPSPATVTVTAVSNDDPTKTANATVTVTAAAVPPTISGTPSTTATVGKAYSFTPTATGASGVTLTFSIANQPSWATFNSATGQLSGTPAAGAVGTYANISISVSDGTNTATLAPFTITVAAASTGSATLTWAIPTTRADGSALTNLAGFHIYYGTTPGSYATAITVANATVSTYVVSNLPSGTYYFVATAYDATGLESAYTTSASKTIP